MKRRHLFELEDQTWFPALLRELMTDHLSFLASHAQGSYRDFVARLHQAMRACGETRLVELCSGGGGPGFGIASSLRRTHAYPVTLLMTDLYPNQERLQRVKDSADHSVDFCPHPIDATQLPAALSGFRLLCNGFHHFRPDQARAILRDAVEKRQGIALAELLERSWQGFLQAAFLAVTPFLATPFLRPLRGARFFFTYVVPVLPLCLLWDGVVSCLRIYAPDELQALCSSLSAANPAVPYRWEIGQARVPFVPVPVTYLVGYPRPESGGSEPAG